MVVRYLEQPTLEKHVCRERQLEKPAAGAGAANGKSKGRGKTLIGDCVQWTTKGSVLSMWKVCNEARPREKTWIPLEKVRVSSPALQQGNPWVKEHRKVRVLQENKTSRFAMPWKRAIVQKEIPVINGIRLSATFIKEKLQTWE